MRIGKKAEVFCTAAPIPVAEETMSVGRMDISGIREGFMGAAARSFRVEQRRVDG